MTNMTDYLWSRRQRNIGIGLVTCSAAFAVVLAMSGTHDARMFVVAGTAAAWGMVMAVHRGWRAHKLGKRPPNATVDLTDREQANLYEALAEGAVVAVGGGAALATQLGSSIPAIIGAAVALALFLAGVTLPNLGSRHE
ncbi:hypothetical protein [Mycobacterium servetii]|uniref:Uncharacterized protein n=1 Tax=Mycobacterium servetii TaxID=3237418 RepID=A0ABV4C9D5_9MYCO